MNESPKLPIIGVRNIGSNPKETYEMKERIHMQTNARREFRSFLSCFLVVAISTL